MNKNIFKTFIWLLAIVFTLQACSEEGLSPENYDKLTPDNFPQTDADIQASVTSIYNSLGVTWVHRYIDNSHLVVSTLCTDELISAWGGEWQKKDRFLWTPTTYFVKNLYFTYTKGITNSTLLLDLLEKSEISNKDLQKRFIAEVRALRAYFAFQLYDLYGPVPIITDVEIATNITEIHKPERPSKEEIVSFVETELDAIKDDLPIVYSSNTDYGRITKGAVLTMLMKLYLHEKNFQKVKDITGEIEALNHYDLLASYDDVFSTKTENNENKEIILAIPKIADGYGTSWYACVLPQTPRYRPLTGITVNIWGGLKSPWEFYDTFEEDNDDRLGESLIRYYVDKDGNDVDFRAVVNGKAVGASPKKYREDPDHIGNWQGNDIIRYRYADVLLARAEAINEIDGPTQDVVDLVNRIRNRVHTTPIAATGWTKDTMRDYILAERARELFCEGHRREDLIRHGKLVEKAHALGRMDAAPHHVLFPIPQSLIDENPNVTQNPGY